MISASRLAARWAILMFRWLCGSKSRDSVHQSQFLKRKVTSRQPCLTPVFTSKGSVSFPLRITWHCAFVQLLNKVCDDHWDSIVLKQVPLPDHIKPFQNQWNSGMVLIAILKTAQLWYGVLQCGLDKTWLSWILLVLDAVSCLQRLSVSQGWPELTLFAWYGKERDDAAPVLTSECSADWLIDWLIECF